MDIAQADIVRSTAGRDKGKLFFVLDGEGEYLLLADGKTRKLERPKRKKRRHVRFVSHGDCRVAEKIRRGESLTDSELRRTLARLGGEGNPDQGGMSTWQNPT